MDSFFNNIVEGSKITQEYSISRDVYDHFLAAFQDTSPIHIMDDYAQTHGFREKVMHGNILNGFISHFVGVKFPGEKSLLQSVSIQYKNPSYMDDRIRINAEVSQVVESVRVIKLDMELQNLTQGIIAATAKVQVGIRE